MDFDSIPDDSALSNENPQAQLAAQGAKPLVNAVTNTWEQGGQNIHNALSQADQGNYTGLQNMAVQNAMSTIGAQQPEARFLGYQETGEAGQAIPLFNVMGEGHPLHNSTVGLDTLAQHGIAAPEVPTFEQWTASQSKPSFAEGGVIDFDSLQADNVSQLSPNTVPIHSNLSQSDQNAMDSNSVNSPQKGISFDDLQDDQDKYGSTGQQALAGLEGAAEGIAGPLAPMAEVASGLTTPEAMRGRAEANPYTHGGAKAAAFIGSMATGVGEGALVAKAGEAVAKAANLSSRIGSAALRGATEMGILQTGDELTRSIVQDPDASVQTAIADVGLASLLGAGGGAAFSAVAPLWEATIGNKATKLIEDFKGRANQRLNNPATVDAVSDELQAHYDNVKNVANDVYGPTGLKSRDIAKAMPEMHEGISEQTSQIGEKLAKSVNKMIEKPYNYPERLVGKIQNDINEYESIIQKPESTPDQIFNATQDLKQTLQGYSKFGMRVAPHDEAYDFIRETKGLAHTLRESLEDESVWKNAAIRQREINKAFTEFKPSLEAFERKFTVEVPDLEAGGVKRIIDPAKINTYINQLGKPSAEIKQSMLKDFLQASGKYSEVLSKSHYNLGLESPFEHSPLAATHSTLQEITPGMHLFDTLVKSLPNATGVGIGSGVGGTLGHSTGLPSGGRIGAILGGILGEKTLSPLIKSILPAIMKPLLEGRADANGLKAAAEYGASILKGDMAMTKGAKNIFKAGAEVLPLSMIPTLAKREQLTKLVANLQNNPGQMPTNSAVAGYMPDHGVALGSTVGNATRYITSQLPDKSKQNPLDSTPVENTAQKAARTNTLNIAQQPLVVYSKVKDGTVTQQDVASLNAMYPALYNKMKQKVSDELTSHISKGGIVPYQTRIGLSIFLGQPMDSTFTGMSILAAQPQPSQQAPQQQMGKPPSQSSMKGLSKLPQSYQTPSQASQQRAVNHK